MNEMNEQQKEEEKERDWKEYLRLNSDNQKKKGGVFGAFFSKNPDALLKMKFEIQRKKEE